VIVHSLKTRTFVRRLVRHDLADLPACLRLRAQLGLEQRLHRSKDGNRH
jgi:hypothetical protein